MASRIVVASIVATLAFWAYTQTLLPGVDLGDTGGFQAAVLWPEVSARQAYPLYYALARPFVGAASPDNPARALNLFSAMWAAGAVGLLTLLCASVTGSLAGGACAGLLLAFSYTFWSQAVIAEVYSLHLALVALCLLALYAYAAKPTTRRLAIVFAVYAFSFGNHLAMILLLVPFAVFVLQAAGRPRDVIRPGVVALALVMAAAGALQYWPNFLAVWASTDAPERWTHRLAAFWLDATKQDWRESMVLGIRGDQAGDRLAMWWFDTRQQFGIAGLALAVVGLVSLWRLSQRWAILTAGAYGICTAFALTYNVGDSHVFFLPGHFMTAFCAGAAVALDRYAARCVNFVPVGTRIAVLGARSAPRDTANQPRGSAGISRGGAPWLVTRRARIYAAPRRAVNARPTILAVAIPTLAIVYALWRGWSTWPAVDRHDDRRGEQLIARLALGVDERNSLFVSQMNWQLENVLLYFGRYQRPDLAWVRLDDVLRHFPFLLEDNHAISRDLVMTAEAAAEITAAYGSRFEPLEDALLPSAGLSEIVSRVPRGAPYVWCLLTPPRDEYLDPDVTMGALAVLTGGRLPSRTTGEYELIAGVAGEAPYVYRSSNRPFAERFRIQEDTFVVRLDSWLPSDTFRRAGFGHVLRGREHILILERGVNMVWLAPDGRPSPPFYGASLFAPKPRYRLPAATLQLAELGHKQWAVRSGQ